MDNLKQQLFTSNPNYDRSSQILDTKIIFLVNNKGRLNQIIWHYLTSFAGEKESTWGNEKQERWNLESDANEYDLMRAFKHLALGNPEDFKKLYYVLKEHDDVTFPCIEETLKEIQELFNFN